MTSIYDDRHTIRAKAAYLPTAAAVSVKHITGILDLQADNLISPEQCRRLLCGAAEQLTATMHDFQLQVAQIAQPWETAFTPVPDDIAEQYTDDDLSFLDRRRPDDPLEDNAYYEAVMGQSRGNQ